MPPSISFRGFCPAALRTASNLSRLIMKTGSLACRPRKSENRGSGSASPPAAVVSFTMTSAAALFLAASAILVANAACLLSASLPMAVSNRLSPVSP